MHANLLIVEDDKLVSCFSFVPFYVTPFFCSVSYCLEITCNCRLGHINLYLRLGAIKES